MIEQLIDLFDASVTAPVVTKHGLAILGNDGPLKRTQAGQYTPIAVDNEAPWSYWRIGDIKSTPYDIYACSMGALQQVPLRLVMLLPNDCGQRDILLAAGRAVTATTGAAKELLGAARVRVVGQRIAVDGVGQAEKISDIPLQWSLIAIDMDLEVIGTADCLVGCEDGPSVLCSVITTATNAEVVECLGDRINEICESGPSDPVTVANSDGSYAVQVPCGEGLILPDVTNTDSDGTPVTLPAQTPFVATPCGASGADVHIYDAEHTTFPGAHTLPPEPYVRNVYAVDGRYAVTIGPEQAVGVAAQDGSNFIIRVYAPLLRINPATEDIQPPLPVGLQDQEAGVSIRDTDGTEIGQRGPDDTIGTMPVLVWVVPDGVVTLPNGAVVSLPATQPYTVPRTAPLKVVFGAGDAVSLLFTATVEEAGTYLAGSIGTGTVQVSINGGTFASGAFSLSIGQTFQAKRSAFTAQDTATWARS